MEQTILTQKTTGRYGPCSKINFPGKANGKSLYLLIPAFFFMLFGSIAQTHAQGVRLDYISSNNVNSSGNYGDVEFEIEFQGSVSGLNSANFSAITSGGLSAGNIGVYGPYGPYGPYGGVYYYYYYIDVSYNGSGTLALTMANTTGVTPSSISGVPGTQSDVVTIAPYVYPSLTIGGPSVSGTSSGPVSFPVTYAGSNLSVSLTNADIHLSTSGSASVGTIGVTGSGTSYTVTFSSITGNGAFSFNIPPGTAQDDSFNQDSGGSSSQVTVSNPVALNSITVAVSGPTNASSVPYTVTFGAAVSGLTAANFSLSGIADATMGTPTTSDGGITWTVPVNTGTGDGTITLSLANATGLSPAVSTSLPFPGNALTIDKTPPQVTGDAYSSSNSSPTWAKAGDVITLNTDYSEQVQNPTVTIGGNSVAAVNIAGNLWRSTYVIGPGDAEGPYAFDIKATDFAGNTTDFNSNDIGFGVTVDQTPPTTSIGSPSATSANSGPVTYTVTYGDANFNVATLSPADITLNTTGTATGTVGVSNSGNTSTVTISNITGDGTLGISVGPGTANDHAGNLAPAAGPSGTFAVDNTLPVVSSIAATTPSNTNPTNATSLTYTVTFSEAVTGVDAGDFTAITTGSVAGGYVGVTPVSGSVYTVTVPGITGTGTLRLDLNATGTGITDGAGNAVSGGFSGGDTYAIDRTPPQVTSSTYSTNNSSNPLWAKAGDVITLNVIYNEPVKTPVVTIGGHSVTPVNVTGNHWQATYTLGPSDAEGNYGFDIKATDLAGNSGEFSSDDEVDVSVTVDQTPPAISIGNPSASFINAGAGSVSYDVTYSDANFGAGTLNTGDITVNTTGTATGTVGVSNSGNVSTVTISNITGLGTIGISVGAGTARDAAGNLAGAAGPSATFTVRAGISALTNLTINHGASLTPAFDPAQLTYTSNVPYSTNQISLTPACDTTASVTVNGISVSSGTKSQVFPLNVGDNTLTTVVTADDATTTTYTVVVTRAGSPNAYLSNLKMNSGSLALSPAFRYNTTAYTATVTSATTSVTVTPAVVDSNATIKVNGTTVTSGTASHSIALVTGTNVINTVVTAADGTTQLTYTITVTRPSTNTNLSNLKISSGTLTPAFHYTTTDYTASVTNATTTIKVTPASSDPNATIKVNGASVLSGNTSAAISLAVGANTITTVVTAQDGVTTKTYTIIVNRPSNNANLSNLKINNGAIALSPGFNYNTTSYNASVANTTASVRITPATSDPNATVSVNGTTVISGTASASLPLAVGPNTITTVVTAQDGTDTKTYTITVTRAAPAGLNSVYQPISVAKPVESPQLEGDVLAVHQGISPNGDGIDDFLTIDGITSYPDNKLTIMNRNGMLVYEVKGYDNASKIFDGHSNKTGALQSPGTYFYSLDYNVKGVTKHKTGFIVLKY